MNLANGHYLKGKCPTLQQQLIKKQGKLFKLKKYIDTRPKTGEQEKMTLQKQMKLLEWASDAHNLLFFYIFDHAESLIYGIGSLHWEYDNISILTGVKISLLSLNSMRNISVSKLGQSHILTLCFEFCVW